MYFDEEFCKSLPEDSSSAIKEICKKYSDVFSNLPDTASRYLLIVEFYAFIAVYYEANGLGIKVPEVEGDYSVDSKEASRFVENLLSETSRQMGQNAFQRYKNLFATRLGTRFHYEFSEGDLKRIQDLINELRDLISASEELEAKHKRRVLDKLEKLQAEFHKKVSDLDQFYGSLIELSVVARIIGENFKPVVDRIGELVKIVWPVQARAFDLPSNAPFQLPGQSESDTS